MFHRFGISNFLNVACCCGFDARGCIQVKLIYCKNCWGSIDSQDIFGVERAKSAGNNVVIVLCGCQYMFQVHSV